MAPKREPNFKIVGWWGRLPILNVGTPHDIDSDDGSSSCSPGEVMVFHPTWEEFKDFEKFLEFIEEKGAHKMGLAKIVPPKQYVPRKADIDLKGLMIHETIMQTVQGCEGVYTLKNKIMKPMSAHEFKTLAESSSHQSPLHEAYDDLEKNYWSSITSHNPTYLAAAEGTLTDAELKVWNLNSLPSILSHVKEDYGQTLPGINSSYLCFGSYKSLFAWQTEDMDLYSINVLHSRAPKTWYGISPEYGRQFEKLVTRYFPEYFRACPGYLRHNLTIMSPEILKKRRIPYHKVTQEQGEIIITFPYGYHSGFNNGFNIAEATNFATTRWIQYGKYVKQCSCGSNAGVRFSMDTFVKRYQPHLYRAWQDGRDKSGCPQDPSRNLPAPQPTIRDFACNKRHFPDPSLQPLFLEIVKRSRTMADDSCELRTQAKAHSKIPLISRSFAD
ncbi:probable lysine-specific demethylase 4B isoform X1 [Hyalella azteca]|uniref:Probable lysine-specific demethylase 4B isoform X1 n=2 Tax=Hyalella azteca TaxID=294128 RepID=A0A8B7PHE2_HYAAZ|nr:probable lysine-specific demethylase 4B isoform X1 [Hyalella azteca]